MSHVQYSTSLQEILLLRHSQTSSLLNFCLIYCIFATNSMSMTAKSNENVKKSVLVPTIEIKLKITADSKAGKQAPRNRH